MTLTHAGLALLMLMNVAAFYIGKDAGVDEERARNARRRTHRIAANRPRTTTNNPER